MAAHHTFIEIKFFPDIALILKIFLVTLYQLQTTNLRADLEICIDSHLPLLVLGVNYKKSTTNILSSRE